MLTLWDILEDLACTFMVHEVGELEIYWGCDHMVIQFEGDLPFSEYYTWVEDKWVCSTDWDLNQ